MRVFVAFLVLLFVVPVVGQDHPSGVMASGSAPQKTDDAQLQLAQKDLQIANLAAEVIQLRLQLRLIQHAVFGNEAEDATSAANQRILNAQQVVNKLQQQSTATKK